MNDESEDELMKKANIIFDRAREDCQYCSKYPKRIYSCQYHEGYEDGMYELIDIILGDRFLKALEEDA